MKDQFEFYGIKSPKRKELTQMFIKKKGLPPIGQAESVIKEIWNYPEREFQYAALDILERFVKKKMIQNVVLFEQFILSKSWWDTVDWLATRIIGVHFQQFPIDILSTHKRRWMDSGNMWLQRVCILFQLKYKQMSICYFQLLNGLQSQKNFLSRKLLVGP